MTEEKAIEILKRIRMVSNFGFSLEEITDVFDMTINALERQIPKKPDYQINGFVKHDKCPCCGSFTIDEYCIHCGQAIDWGENDD